MRLVAPILIVLLTCVSGFRFTGAGKGVFWNKTEHDFGNIRKGEKVSTRFTCYNKGDSALVFENVVPSCGCVVPSWNRNPILPGDSAVIAVEFDSGGKNNKHHKSIAVYSNQGLFELYILVNIIK